MMPEHRVLLHDKLSLHTLETEKWNKAQVEGQIDRWVKFLREGKDLDDENLPDYMQTKEMKQAMSTLRQFSEKERNYHQYQARQNYIRERRCIEEERDQAVQQRDQALEERDQALEEWDQTEKKLDQALEELEKLRKYHQKLH